MREILFRGKRVDNGEWETGSLLVERMNTSDQQVMIADKMTGYPTLVLPETVGQYTGLTDKNGKQIFEGDIVGAKHPEQKKAVPCLVKYGEYEDEDGRVDCRYLGFCLEVFDKCCSILTPLSDGIEYEVIGNVHDGGAYD